jgi:hypothetical protein
MPLVTLLSEKEGNSHFRATASECQDWRAEKSISTPVEGEGLCCKNQSGKKSVHRAEVGLQDE